MCLPLCFGVSMVFSGSPDDEYQVKNSIGRCEKHTAICAHPFLVQGHHGRWGLVIKN